MKILDVYKSMAKELFIEAEVDDDKIIKYKKKDGEQGEMKASSAKTMEKDHPAKIAYDKMTDSDSDSDTPKGQALSGGDFDRDGDGDVDQDDTAGDPDDSWDDEEGRAKPMGKTDADTDDDPIEPDEKKLYEPTYYDDDPEFEKRYGYEPDAHIRSFNDEEREEIINKMADDAGVSVDDPIELVKIVRGKDEYGNAALGDIHKHIKDMADKEDKYDDETTSKITARNNPNSADAFFTNPYETIQINGKKYRPIKESKKEEKTFAEKIKENSKRFAKRK